VSRRETYGNFHKELGVAILLYTRETRGLTKGQNRINSADIKFLISVK
jgi:hypothetical protein